MTIIINSPCVIAFAILKSFPF